MKSLVFALLFVLFVGCKPAVVTPNDRATELGLFVVSNSLVAPSTCKFSSVSCQHRADDTFLVSGKVDSQNSYGAMLRQDFICVLTNLGNDKLDWLGVTVGEQAQINNRLVPNDVTIVSSQIVGTGYGGQKCIKGRIKNTSGHIVRSISVSFDLYHSDGAFASQAFANMIGEELHPDAVWDFSSDGFDSGLTPKLHDLVATQ